MSRWSTHLYIFPMQFQDIKHHLFPSFQLGYQYYKDYGIRREGAV